MMVVGITGPTGSGKTTALNAIRELGGCVLDLDAVYHGLLKTDRNLLNELDGRFPGVIQNGELDRKALGSIVFAENKNALSDLNAITGKYILAGKRIGSWLRLGRRDFPLPPSTQSNLLEGDLPDRCDVTVAVTAPVEIRVKLADGPGSDFRGVCPAPDFGATAQ